MPTTDNLLNFYDLRNELYTADALNTPLLTMSGGLTGGLLTKNFDFPTSVAYALPAADQNVVSEAQSLLAPGAVQVARAQVPNTCQIHHHAIQVSYKHMASMGRLSGIATGGVTPNVDDEVDFQVARKLEVCARDIEFSFIQGQFVAAGAAADVAQTRGICGADGVCRDLVGGLDIDQGAAALDLASMQNFFLQAYNNGAMFNTPILYVSGRLKQVISGIYGFAPADRNIGGVNIQQIETDFGPIGIVTSRFAPADTVALIEMSVVSPVFQEVPGKGTIFYEELAKTGGSVQGQVFGIVGFDHGPAFAHAELWNIG